MATKANNKEIYINARFLTQKVTGVQRFAIEICDRLTKKIGNKKVVLIGPKSKRVTKLRNQIQIVEIGNLSGNLWEQIDLPLYLNKVNNPLLINLVGIGPVFYRNKIIAVYDLAFKHHPKWFSFKFRTFYNLLIPISIKNTIHLITDSQYVKKDIINTYRVKKQNCTVIYAAASKKFYFKNLQREKIILTVSSIDPRKNLKSIIEAYKQIKTDYKLVIVGKKSKSFAETDLDTEELESNVEFTGYLSDDELLKLYNSAEIFVYASFFEGFGIPPLEAQACGCSCIVSNVTSLPEVYGDSVLYCDPFDIKSISSAMSELLEDLNLRERLKQNGFTNAKRFDWDKSARKMTNLIEDVENGKISNYLL